MQFILDPAIMGGGYFPPTSALPKVKKPVSQAGSPEMLGTMLQQAGSVPSFQNLFGTGPGAIKSVSTKPDGSKTTTYNTPPIEALPAAEAVRMAQGLETQPRQVGLGPQPAMPELTQQAPALGQAPAAGGGFFSGLGNALRDPGVFGALGQVGAAIGGPGSFAERLGGFASNQARNRLFDQYLQNRLAGAGGAGQQAPFNISALGTGLLSPQEQLAATNQPLTELGALSDAAYKQALISGVETPEQQLNRQVLLTLLGREGAQPRAGSIQSLTLDPSGKQTRSWEKWKWLVDPITGNKIKPIGPDTDAPPQAGVGSESQERLWYKEAVEDAVRRLGTLGVGEIISDKDGNPIGINWNYPDRDAHLLDEYIVKSIKDFQSLGRIPAGFEKPFEARVQVGTKPKSSLLK